MADKILTKTAVDQIVKKLADDPSIAVESGAQTKDIVAAVNKEVTAVVVNQTNQEPWYQSRVIVGQYVMVVVAILGALGWTVAPEYKEAIVAFVLAAGGLVNPAWTLYARFFAKKPLGQ